MSVRALIGREPYWGAQAHQLTSMSGEERAEYYRAHSIPEGLLAELEHAARVQDEQDGSGDGLARLKLFNPAGAATWFISEARSIGDDWELYGLCDLGMGFPELGYVLLSELGSLRCGAFRLPIERDLYWEPQPVKSCGGAA